MKNFVILFCFLVSLSIEAQTENKSDCTKVYLIRHAEKDRTDKTNSNPHLNSLGTKRSLKWKDFFKNINFDIIYSTNYHRTLETIKPFSENGTELIIYNPSKIDYNEFVSNNKGKTILVVGHSNTIPTFTNRISNKNLYNDIEDNNNSNLYVVNICNGIDPQNSLYFVK
ncbi:MAG: phosphoglycerate mutase family protein [Flavobacteriaceae bacterium]|nr:histidine phosphatase family protein [Flavobacteriaceae bacterium]MDG1032067.1 phosphoglycerate mutase family protein [Flavobacteriaceae bacterium]MDG1344500.1 phosphoglycerate mutase family protein [Flavobacteriaceae bacterium]MDG1792074.1 phosphoglycerate mutase family protein [Flavobacteriaceae bacterium]MDG2485079.1 phosphoglycerate mutase family protein [Flavobacteriaceae bacterium]|tara:strand:+ start:2024 stop:2530 length:507 start_codon:yes stop_codon:yes gene_type:complete